MKLRTLFSIFLCTSIIFDISGQSRNTGLVGYYSDRKGIMCIDELHLNEDGTFVFSTLDPDLGGLEKFTTQGEWTSKGNEVFLNPDKSRRERELIIVEEKRDSLFDDFIVLKINYQLVEYENEQLKGKRNYNFDRLNFWLNDTQGIFKAKRNPTTSKKLLIGPDNTIKISKSKFNINQLTRITIDSNCEIKLIAEPKNMHANYFELDLIHGLDVERTPRNRRILIDGKKAYIHEYSGKIDQSLLAMPLKKRKRKI
ncbi:MAG: hypothetical protein AAFZ15_21470 [Bacteroidota bacterium]